MQPQLFTVEYLQTISGPSFGWYKASEPYALVGRCLLDTVEYFTTPEIPGRFHDLADAHAIRLSLHCLTDVRLNRPTQLKSLATQLKVRLASLLERSKETPPFFGIDYWDWAAILECFLEAKNNGNLLNSIVTDQVFDREMTSFRDAVTAKIGSGLTIKSKGEWYGPASAAAAYKILQRWDQDNRHGCRKVLDKLEKHALGHISKGRYRGRKVEAGLTLWHYGQVVHVFPKNRTVFQQQRIRELSAVGKLDDKAYRAYVLSRVIEGAHAVNDRKTERKAVDMLYDCQYLERPFGQGLVGENIKGSLNVLEALWPTLDDGDIRNVAEMLDALAAAHSRENTVGVLVAIPEELEAVRTAFVSDGAHEEPGGSQASSAFSQPIYRAAIRLGKGHIDSEDATQKLLTEDKAKWLFMVGVAGSLGSQGGTPTGPQVGDVVLAASIAPHNVRIKAREVIESAPVPYRGATWTVVPTSPSLYSCAARAASQVFPKESSSVRIHEGVIVTGHLTDNTDVKADILSKWPGGLAIEEEGYIFALLCLHDERPYMVIRGIMDFAGGDKKGDRGGGEEARKKTAAENAARVLVKAINILSQRW